VDFFYNDAMDLTGIVPKQCSTAVSMACFPNENSTKSTPPNVVFDIVKYGLLIPDNNEEIQDE